MNDLFGLRGHPVAMSLAAAVVVGLAGLPLMTGCDATQATTVNKPQIQHVPVKPGSELTNPRSPQLLEKINHAVDQVRERSMSPQVNNAWHIVHGLLAYGYELPLEINGTVMPGLQWILDGGHVEGWTFVPGAKGLDDVMEPGSKKGEGHPDQWLGYLSLAGLDLDTPMVVRGNTYRIRDLVEQAKWDVRENSEATWTLMAFNNYLPLDARWQARDGSEWTIERMAEMEAKQEVPTAACGGSHRLYAIASALKRHTDAGGQITGGWVAAADTVDKYVELAFQYQQPDGCFSSDFFQRAAATHNASKRISTTGHILEFLCVALPNDQLAEPWVTKSVNYLCNQIEALKDEPIECGGLYHAAHALRLYRERMFGVPAKPAGPGMPASTPATTPANKTAPVSKPATPVLDDRDLAPPLPR